MDRTRREEACHGFQYGRRVKTKSIGSPDPMDAFLGLYEATTADDDECNDDPLLMEMESLSFRDCKVNLPPEVECGRREYKLKLINPSDQRLRKLVTQMKWRLREGQGEAIYEIGVADDGFMTGLNDSDMSESLKTLRSMASTLGASMTILRRKSVVEDDVIEMRSVTEVLVRKIPDDRNSIDIRMAVMGNVDAGKSTLIGVLTQGLLDNGFGAARLNMFRHPHEVESGRTSSISNEILGFDEEGTEINYSVSMSAEEICSRSSKVVTFIDLAGHAKYLHTTIRGITGYAPHYVMLVVSGNTGVVGTTREHLGLALALEVPVFVVITKVDMTPPETLKKTLSHIENLLKSPGVRKVPMRIEDEDTVLTAGMCADGSIVPIFLVSSVTGTGLDLLKQYLHVLSPLTAKEREKLMQEPPEFHVYEIVRLPRVGTVLGGLVRKGVITEGSEVLIGPFEMGMFQKARVQSVHRNKQPYRAVYAGHSASVVLDMEFGLERKGMILLCPMSKPVAVKHFTATICVLFHSTEIHAGFETTVYIGSVQQTAVIERINNPARVRTNDHASVVFRFKQYPEFVLPGSRLFFRTGTTKGIGKVTKVSKIIDDFIR